MSGIFGAYCYSTPSLRPLAHSLGVWIVVAVLCAHGRRPRQAAIHATVALELGVLAFYSSKHLLFGSYSLDLSNLALWAVVALLSGAALGVAGAYLGKTGRSGIGAAALIVGLLLGDAYGRVHNYRVDIAAVLDITAALIMLGYHTQKSHSLRQGIVVVGAAVPMTLVGYVLTLLPNWLQQIMLERL